MKTLSSALFMLILPCIGPPASTSASAEEFPALARYGDWSVFADSGDCWVSSKPVLSTDTQLAGMDDRARLLVTYRTNGQPSEVSFVGRFLFEGGQAIHAAFGTDRIDFFFENGEGAWPENVESDKRMQHEMAKGTQVVLHTWSPDGSEMVDVFSLIGFQAAAKDAALRCGQ